MDSAAFFMRSLSYKIRRNQTIKLDRSYLHLIGELLALLSSLVQGRSESTFHILEIEASLVLI